MERFSPEQRDCYSEDEISLKYLPRKGEPELPDILTNLKPKTLFEISTEIAMSGNPLESTAIDMR